MNAYYNEIEPYAAQWLRNLIAAGHIAPGEVDVRSIDDIHPDDLRGFTQCHFFAGIGVWSLALRRAGWPDDRPVWTGSCPCQPFSSAGQGAGFADERHLWPAWHHLIRERRPAVVLGEQVASKDAEPWLDLVQDDMEAMDYAFGAVPFPAAGVGAPHIRDRLYWVANTDHERRARQYALLRPEEAGRKPVAFLEASGRSASGGMGDARPNHDAGQVAPASDRCTQAIGSANQPGGPGISPCLMGDADGGGEGAKRRLLSWQDAEPCGVPADGSAGPLHGFWRDADWLYCRDGRWRPVEPGSFPLAHGIAGRVGRLRAYGNAICAPAAQAFIECVMEAMP